MGTLADHLEFLRLDGRDKVRRILKDDFERLTAQPIILDDLCMLLIEKYAEISEELKELGVANGIGTPIGTDLVIRKSQIAEELTLISALILRYPEVPRHYQAKAHVQLDWELLRWLATMPLNNNPPSRGIAVYNYINNLFRNIDALIIIK